MRKRGRFHIRIAASAPSLFYLRFFRFIDLHNLIIAYRKKSSPNLRNHLKIKWIYYRFISRNRLDINAYPW